MTANNNHNLIKMMIKTAIYHKTHLFKQKTYKMKKIIII